MQRKVTISLLDGVPSGTVKANLDNWYGQVLVMLRAALKKHEDELKRPGVYILEGNDENGKVLYIGQTQKSLKRLNQHNANAPKGLDWDRVAILTVNDDQFPHPQYVESELIKIAREKGVKLKNSNISSLQDLPPADRDPMKRFLSEFQTLLPLIGFTYFEPSKQAGGNSQRQFSFTYGKAISYAYIEEEDGSFIVTKGSTALSQSKQSLSSSRQEIRNQLFQAKKLDKSSDSDLWIFTEDTKFNSPSSAASIIAGVSINGALAWMHNTLNIPYRDWENQLIGIE